MHQIHKGFIKQLLADHKIQDNCIIPNRRNRMHCIRSKNTQIAILHEKLLILDEMGTFPAIHIDQFYIFMVMKQWERIACMTDKLHIVIRGRKYIINSIFIAFTGLTVVLFHNTV